MILSSRFTVVYDACVLYPASIRDLLLQLATTRLVRARWSDRIHSEWMENLLVNRPELSRESLENTRDRMNTLPDCLVSGYEHLEAGLELPDVDDRHVLAAAIHGGAQAIVTYNLADFPDSELRKHSLIALHPDEFILDLVDLAYSTLIDHGFQAKSIANSRRLRSWFPRQNDHRFRLKSINAFSDVGPILPSLFRCSCRPRSDGF